MPVPIIVGKRYKGVITGKVFTVQQPMPGDRWLCEREDGRHIEMMSFNLVPLTGEDYSLRGEETAMEVRPGDMITLKFWDDIPATARRPVSTGVQIHKLKQHKDLYDQKTPIQVVATHDSGVIDVKLPLEGSYYPFWSILDIDIYRVLGKSGPKLSRRIRSIAPQIEEEKIEEGPLREVAIKLGETILLKIEGQEELLKVNFGHTHLYKDGQLERGHQRIELTGVVIPQERMRLIRR